MSIEQEKSKIRVTEEGTDNSVIGSDILVKGICSIYICGNCNCITFGSNVEVYKNLHINIFGNGCNIRFGNGTSIEDLEVSICEDGNIIEIGEDCMFSSGVKLVASDFHSIIDLKNGKRSNFPKGIYIGNHVWVGINSLILKNTTIGDGTIIGGGSVVSGRVMDYVIASGNPVKIVKRDTTWDRFRYRDDKSFDLLPKNCKHIVIDDSIVVNLETPYKGQYRKIKGWCFMRGRCCEKMKVWINVNLKKSFHKKSKIVSAYKEKRPDVAEYFGSDLYEDSGFVAWLPNEIDNYSGRYELEIIISYPDGRMLKKRI